MSGLPLFVFLRLRPGVVVVVVGATVVLAAVGSVVVDVELGF